MTENPEAPAFVADIGGTHVRFALSAASAEPSDRQTLECADFESPVIAAESYLSSLQLSERPRIACFAVASPIDADRVDALSRPTSRPPPELRQVLAVLGDALGTLGDADGVRVGEFAAWLASSSLPLDMVLPKSPLVDLLS